MSVQIKLFADKDRNKLEKEVNTWLQGKSFESLDVKVVPDFQYWSVFITYQPKEEAAE